MKNKIDEPQFLAFWQVNKLKKRHHATDGTKKKFRLFILFFFACFYLEMITHT